MVNRAILGFFSWTLRENRSPIPQFTKREPHTKLGSASSKVIAFIRSTSVIMTLAALIPYQALAQVQLPDIGDPSGSIISPIDERRLGEAFMREVRRRLNVVDDAEVSTYIQELGYRIVSQSDQAGGGFEFFVVVDPAINAFAAPGGFVGMHSGLIVASQSESELAAVTAHEIAHVTQRHIARAIALSERSRIPSIAGVLAAIIIGTQNVQAGQAAAAAVTGASVQSQLNFTRSNEQEADRIGMQLLSRAGFDPLAMPAFFERLLAAQRYYRRPPEFLSTHPVTTSRIADSKARAQNFAPRKVTDGLDYHLVREKLRVISSPEPIKVLQFYEAQLENFEDPTPGIRYGYALALVRVGRKEEAGAALRALSSKYPDQISLRAAVAQFETHHGELKTALRNYDDLLSLYPDSRLLVGGYAESLLLAKRNQQALELVEDYGRLHHFDSALYRLKAEAHGALGQTTPSHMALAEHYYQNGELQGAIQQLRLASRDPQADYYTSSRVTARLRELEAEFDSLRRRR